MQDHVTSDSGVVGIWRFNDIVPSIARILAASQVMVRSDNMLKQSTTMSSSTGGDRGGHVEDGIHEVKKTTAIKCRQTRPLSVLLQV